MRTRIPVLLIFWGVQYTALAAFGYFIIKQNGWMQLYFVFISIIAFPIGQRLAGLSRATLKFSEFALPSRAKVPLYLAGILLALTIIIHPQHIPGDARYIHTYVQLCAFMLCIGALLYRDSFLVKGILKSVHRS